MNVTCSGKTSYIWVEVLGGLVVRTSTSNPQNLGSNLKGGMEF